MTIGYAIQKFEKQRLTAVDALNTLQKHPGKNADPLVSIMQIKYTENKEMAEIALWALCEVERMNRERRRMKAILSQIITLLEENEE